MSGRKISGEFVLAWPWGWGRGRVCVGRWRTETGRAAEAGGGRDGAEKSKVVKVAGGI